MYLFIFFILRQLLKAFVVYNKLFYCMLRHGMHLNLSAIVSRYERIRMKVQKYKSTKYKIQNLLLYMLTTISYSAISSQFITVYVSTSIYHHFLKNSALLIVTF